MSSKLPSMMSAWQCTAYSKDAAHKMLRASAMPVPSPSACQALVKVDFAAANPLDMQLVAGAFQERFPVCDFPFVPGFDAAGEVAALGPDCTLGLQVGDRVVLCLGLAESCSKEAAFGPLGAFAEFCVCPESQICKVPDEMLLSTAAGLPLAGLSAYQALFTGKATSTKGEPLGNVGVGSKVLVLGGDRGPGHFAVQLAKQAGATVYTTAAPSKLDWLRTLGADRVVDWREQDWTAQMRGQDFDLVLDCVGWTESPEEMGKAVKVMKPGGQFISLPDFHTFDPEGVIKDRHFKAMVANVNSQDLELLIQMVARGELDVHLDKIYLFEELPHALAHAVRGQTNGKVVVGTEHAGSTTRGASAGGA
eukprot:CAMPEP_0179208888 /NCGR_PEP_ID=MMETSP0796-20121207/104176_1 /TAXON_ID=73915 /ORGANISM="Pyrodinium bahamense, Strain pbaha01" /LENGTH=363 /DNA_ID=CAMNT_0020913841 /DNA_START=1 /DNA_END=1092 /DNA_ORIENTATION=-